VNVCSKENTINNHNNQRRKSRNMNKLNRMASCGALFAFLILTLAVSTQAQNVTGSTFSIGIGVQESPDRQGPPSATDTTQRLRFWNEIMLKANARDHALATKDQGGPLRTARAFAIVQIAVFNAYNAIVGGYESYGGFNPSLAATLSTTSTTLDITVIDSPDASRKKAASIDAAIIEAAANTLKSLYPQQSGDIGNVEQTDLNTIPNGSSKSDGISIGQQAAQHILALRNNDGSQTPEPTYGVGYTPNPAIGKWRRDPYSTTAENPGPALGAFWKQVKPFVVLSADQFAAAVVPDLTSAAYTTAFNEAKTLGGDPFFGTPTSRTAEQTTIGIYWGYDGTPFLGTPPRLYNQIAVQIAQSKGTAGIRLARFLALVNTAMADAGLASWQTKYRDEFWRPVTAIQQADLDGNPNTIADPNFHPLGGPASNTNNGVNFTPPFPAYTSGHATFGGALFQTLRNFYGTDAIPFSFISDEFNGATRDNKGNIRPLVLRSWQTLSQAEEENGQSRIYLGIHWAFDKTEGIKSGNGAANFVFGHSFRRKNLNGTLTTVDTP
jgi:hypothetical protein